MAARPLGRLQIGAAGGWAASPVTPRLVLLAASGAARIAGPRTAMVTAHVARPPTPPFVDDVEGDVAGTALPTSADVLTPLPEANVVTSVGVAAPEALSVKVPAVVGDVIPLVFETPR